MARSANLNPGESDPVPIGSDDVAREPEAASPASEAPPSDPPAATPAEPPADPSAQPVLPPYLDPRLLTLLGHLIAPGQSAEVEVITGPRQGEEGRPVSWIGRFDSRLLRAFGPAQAILFGNAQRVRIMLNPVRPDLFECAPNEFREGVGPATDADVTCRRWLPIVIRPSESAVGGEEHLGSTAISETADRLVDLLTGHGVPTPLGWGTSDGVVLLVRADLSVESGGLAIEVLEALADHFDGDGVRIDRHPGSPTIAIEFDGPQALAEAPPGGNSLWISDFVLVPAEIEVASPDQLRAVAAAARGRDVASGVGVPAGSSDTVIAEPDPGEGAAPDGFIDSFTFARCRYTRRWLVEEILADDQNAVLGGPVKSLKTGILTDLLVSLSNGTPFLGRFAVPRRLRVAVLSGESGPATLQDTAARVCRARGITLADCQIHWGFTLPGLGSDEGIRAFQQRVAATGAGLVAIDPAYLCLFGPGGVSPTDRYAAGQHLRRVCRACREAGAFPVLVYHTTKRTPADRGEPIGLAHLSHAGAQEFFRQWLLVSPRQNYDPQTGTHRLWLSAGGSAGHASRFAVDVVEGRLNSQFGGRGWDVRVRDETEAVETEGGTHQQSSGQGAADEEEIQQKVLDYMRAHPVGGSESGIARAIGVHRPRCVRVLKWMVKALRLVETDPPSGVGGNPKTWYRSADVASVTEPRSVDRPEAAPATTGPGSAATAPPPSTAQTTAASGPCGQGGMGESGH